MSYKTRATCRLLLSIICDGTWIEIFLTSFLLVWLMKQLEKRLMETKDMRSTGNLLLNKHINGYIRNQKYQNRCTYMKHMLVLVDPTQRLPRFVSSPRRFSLMLRQLDTMQYS